jgi:hypothetical protein
MRPMRYRGWIAAAAALALIGAPQLRGYCLTACNTAGAARVVGPVETSTSCHDSREAPSGNPSSNPAAPGRDGCCDHTRIVQGALPSAAPTHNLHVAAVAPYPAVPGAGWSREGTSLRLASTGPALFRSLAVLRL